MPGAAAEAAGVSRVLPAEAAILYWLAPIVWGYSGSRNRPHDYTGQRYGLLVGRPHLHIGPTNAYRGTGGIHGGCLGRYTFVTYICTFSLLFINNRVRGSIGFK